MQANLPFIRTEADLTSALSALALINEDMRRLISLVPRPPLRLRPNGFEGLARIIVFQQISILAGQSIWERFITAFNPLSPAQILVATEEELRACGLSRPKIKTLKNVSLALQEGWLTPDHLENGDEEALTAISGIGPWSISVYQLSCLGVSDCFPAGDLALQLAIQKFFLLPEKPSAQQSLEIAERWRPYRAIAARLLWGYYTQVKSGKIEQIP